MAFTRYVVFMKWTDGTAQHYCFYAKYMDYAGGGIQKPASYSRGLFAGGLNRVYAPNAPRAWSGTFQVDDTPPGEDYDDGLGGTDIPVGDIDDLKSAHGSTDLQVFSFEDTAYWNAEWKGDWLDLVVYDPKRSKADVQASIVSR